MLERQLLKLEEGEREEEEGEKNDEELCGSLKDSWGHS